jgi:S-adenosylmethionine hydrolase
MSKSQNTFIKNQKEKKKQQKKKEKEEKKKERQENNLKGGELSDMIAYVDEFGNIVDEKPEERPAPKTPPKRKEERDANAPTASKANPPR